MTKLIIKNGLVYDPLNKIKGEVKDILVEDGKIVEDFSSEGEVKEIDASDKTVIPAALDIHTHAASQQTNWARLLGTENKLFQKVWNGLTLESIARNYISNGYTFILESNVYPSLARQTTFNFEHLPVLDKGMLLNASNLWALESEFERDKIEEMAAFISDLLRLSKGFGIKVYNPFEAESWNFNILRNQLDKDGRLYSFSPLAVYENLTRAAEKLQLPHSIHAHIEGYETETAKKNVRDVLEKVKSIESELSQENGLNRTQIFHLAHANAYNIDGDNSYLIDLLNSNGKIDLDVGMVSFNEINPLITSDRHLIDQFTKSSDYKVIRNGVESEGDSFATLRQLKKSNKRHCTLWANALELALKVENKWQVQLSFNFPNYSDVSNIPTISTWLVSKKARKAFIDEMNEDIAGDMSIASLDDELSFNEFIILTRASPAKSLGLAGIKGGFTPGADGDINILNMNIDEVDLSNDFDQLEASLQNIEYVIKNGKVVKHGDKIDLNENGRIFWADGHVDAQVKERIIPKKKEFYQKYYSMFYDRLECHLKDDELRKVE